MIVTDEQLIDAVRRRGRPGRWRWEPWDRIVGWAVILGAVMSVAVALFGQEPAVAPDAATWADKLRTAIESGEAVVLTAEEAQALATAYTGIEQRQVADVAVSGTHCYALSSVGTVLAQAEVSR